MGGHRTTLPNSAPQTWDGALHWLADVGHQLAHWVTWTLNLHHLAGVAMVGASLGVLIGTLRVWHLKRLLSARRAWAVIPTDRYTRMLSDELVADVGKILSQVQRRALGLRWWMWPASAIRVRLDPTNYGGTIYSISGPPWAREVIETTGYTGIILCPMDALDLSRLTPKGLYVRPESPFGFDAQTRPDAPLVPAER